MDGAVNFLDLPVSPELKDAFSKANRGQTNVRYLKIRIMNEKLELAGTGNSGTTSLDFNSFQRTLNPEEGCFIVFRYKDTFAEAPWAFILFCPDTLPVRERMSYASSFGAARDALGFKFFSKIKRYSAPSEFVYMQFHNSESEALEGTKKGINASNSNKLHAQSQPTAGREPLSASVGREPVGASVGREPISASVGREPISASVGREPISISASVGRETVSPSLKPVAEEKPWSQRELLLRQLEQDEDAARRDMERAMQQRSVPVLGIAQVAFALTDSVENAVQEMQNGIHNWIQIGMDKPPKKFELVTCKNIMPDELETSVDAKNPQFYLYNTDGVIVVIYSCPEQTKGENFAQGRQYRMVFATAKSSLLEGLQKINLNYPLRKYDIQEPSELTESNLRSHLESKASEIKSAKSLQGSAFAEQSNSGGYRPAYRAGAASSPAHGTAIPLANVMAGYKPLPKGVVKPPRGAYC